MMRFPRLCLLLALAAVVPLRADSTSTAGDWDIVRVEAATTSIYVGRVNLTTSEFKRDGDQYAATYDAKVWPWVFWNEHGQLAITLPPSDIARLEHGERVEFTGYATNHRNKPRTITGWAERHTASTGKIKVRIGVDDTELIFNSTYRAPGVIR